jgi:endonuclease-3
MAGPLAPKFPFPKKKVSRDIALRELAGLEAAYPQAVTALDYESPFTLLIAVILSAQCTDARVNLTTPHLFAAYPTPRALADAPIEDVERIIKSCGFYRMKAKNITAAARGIAEQYGGEVPDDREALEALPGVGRKTASVVLSVAFGDAAFAVDTHVFRVSHRLGLTLGKTPRDVEDDVVKLVEPDKLRFAHHWLILHGRQICKAPTPLCDRCPVRDLCPSAPIVERILLLEARTKTRTALARLKQKTASKPAAKKKVAAKKQAAVKQTAAKPAGKKAAASKTATRTKPVER